MKEKFLELKTMIESCTSELKSDDIKVMAVSKKQGIEKIQLAIEAGINNFGENYIQEAKEKFSVLKKDYPNIILHFIGKLQSNKVKIALEVFDVIHSIDSIKLATKIAKEINEKNYTNKSFFIQVSLDELINENRAGIVLEELSQLIAKCQELNLNIRGLMLITPITDNPAPYFALAYKINQEYNFKELSMGMSNDFMVALDFGASIIRIGRAIFGERE